MRVLAILLAILIGFVTASSAQNEAKAYKFAEFGPMSQTGVNARMEHFLKEFYKNPTSQGYIVSYGSPRAISLRRSQITRSIVSLRPEDIRITFVDGPPKRGIKILTVMWIVPPGATPPTP